VRKQPQRSILITPKLFLGVFDNAQQDAITRKPKYKLFGAASEDAR
jgi:hypothetical protein